MKPVRLVLFPDAVLRKRAEEVKNIDGRLQALIKGMTQIMYEYRGIGLAAPQVGYLQRVIIADVGDGLTTLINPLILHQEGTDLMEEGCLSLPDIHVEIRRSSKIKIQALTPTEKEVVLEFTGLKARVIQHEIDHLNGRLIIDYATPIERLKIKDQLERLEKRFQFNML